MARPIKRGLSYFPLDTDFYSNRKIQRLLQEYGCEGVNVYLAVLCEMYEAHGYYLPYTENVCFDIGFTLRVNEEKVREIVAYCVDVRLFDSQLFNNLKILTSVGIQKRYCEVSKRYPRKMDPRLVLIPNENAFYKDGVSVTKTPIKVTKTPVMVTKTPVKVTKTPIMVTKTPIKGNKKEREIKEKIILKKKSTDGFEKMDDNGESARRAELLQMAAAATAKKQHD